MIASQHYTVLDTVFDTIMANGGFKNKSQFHMAQNALTKLGEELNLRSQAIAQLQEENKDLKAKLEATNKRSRPRSSKQPK